MEKRLAALTEELGKANKVFQEQRCELQELTVSLEARIRKLSRDSEDEELRREDELKWAFWTIE